MSINRRFPRIILAERLDGGKGTVAISLRRDITPRYYFALDAERASRSDRCMLQLEEDREPSSSVGGVVSYTDGTRRCRTDFIRTRGVWRTELWALPSWRVTCDKRYRRLPKKRRYVHSRIFTYSRGMSLVNKGWRRGFVRIIRGSISGRNLTIRVGGGETGRLNNFRREERRRSSR